MSFARVDLFSNRASHRFGVKTIASSRGKEWAWNEWPSLDQVTEDKAPEDILDRDAHCDPEDHFPG